MVSNYRKRELYQIEQDNHNKEFEKLKKKLSTDYRTIIDLKDKLKEFQEQHIEDENNRDKLAWLYELVIIDSNGDYTVKRNDDLIEEEGVILKCFW